LNVFVSRLRSIVVRDEYGNLITNDPSSQVTISIPGGINSTLTDYFNGTILVNFTTIDLGIFTFNVVIGNQGESFSITMVTGNSWIS
jgi:hypothetical protein